MFSKDQTETVFRNLSATPVEELSISQSFSLLVNFYETVKPNDAVPENEDGDMLLFQWGTNRWAKDGPDFTLNLTRQIIYPDGDLDQEIWQLGLTYNYELTGTLTSLKSGNEWCHSTPQAAEFRDVIMGATAFSTCLENTPVAVDLSWDCQ